MDADGVSVPDGARTVSNEAALETVSYSCRRCGHIWVREYEVTTHDYWDGYRIEIYRERGMPAPPPDAPMPCPACGGYRVRVVRSRRWVTVQSTDR